MADASATRGDRRLDTPSVVYLVVASSAAGIATTIHLAWPAARPWLVDEGAVMENISAALAFLAAAAGTWICVRNRERIWPYAAIPALALALLLDEISYGHIFLGYAPPTLGGTEIESVHELVHPAIDLAFAHPLAIALALAGLAGLALLPGVRRRIVGLMHSARDFLTDHPPFRLVLLAVGLGGTALLLDLDAAERLIFVEELLELLAALALAFAAFCIPDRESSTGRLRWNPLVHRFGFHVLATTCVAIAAGAGILFGVE